MYCPHSSTSSSQPHLCLNLSPSSCLLLMLLHSNLSLPAGLVKAGEQHSLWLSVFPVVLQASNSILIIQISPKPFSTEMSSSFSIRYPCQTMRIWPLQIGRTAVIGILFSGTIKKKFGYFISVLCIVLHVQLLQIPAGLLRFCLVFGGQQACIGSCQIFLTPNMAKSPSPNQADAAYHFCKRKPLCLSLHPCPSLQRVYQAQFKVHLYSGQCFRKQTLQTHFCKLDKSQNVLPIYLRKFKVDEKSFSTLLRFIFRQCTAPRTSLGFSSSCTPGLLWMPFSTFLGTQFYNASLTSHA